MSGDLPDIFTFLERHFGLSITLGDPDGEDMHFAVHRFDHDSVCSLLTTKYRDAVLSRLRFEQRKRMERKKGEVAGVDEVR